MDYKSFFTLITGYTPYPYQERLGSEDWPEILDVPTGLGKTAAVVCAWLWKRLQGDPETGRRLVYCLPMRVLVEQTAAAACSFCERVQELFTARKVTPPSVHVLMGGDVDERWDSRPEQPAILVGTQDMLLSRALNRGYGMSPYRWPVQFALLNNDAVWVMDEVQLMGNGLATTAQLQAFRRQLGTASPCRSIWMSATMRRDWLNTVDFSADDEASCALALGAADRDHRQVSCRLTALKPITKAPFMASKDAKAEAVLVVQGHRPGSRTLVIVNTVKRAMAIHDALAKSTECNADLVLVHSRFRSLDRKQALARLLAPASRAGTIAISTQVVEAGVDVSAKTLFTDLAPWSSLVQRFGRCNRAGEFDDAAVTWFDVDLDAKGKMAAPYSNDELERARAKLAMLSDVGPAALPNVDGGVVSTHVVRRRDLVDLFDTTPDLAGADIDVSRFIREQDEHSVQVFWRDLDGVSPQPGEARAHRDELCSAPIGEIRDYCSKKRAWRWDHLEKEWTKVGSVFPGLVLMLRAGDGGYLAERGWSAKSTATVDTVDARGAPESGYDDDHGATRPWKSMSEHTNDVCDELERLLAALPDVDDASRTCLRLAARWHDAGKAHPEFQGAMVPDDDGGSAATVWAKAPHFRRYARPGFRHELASAVAMLLHGLPDLAAYLAAAHHGKVRLSIRSLPQEKAPDDPTVRFARGVWDGDVLAACELGDGVELPETELDLSFMELGDGSRGASWLARMIGLRDDPAIGPFRLAYLEALMRVADWRGSANKEVDCA